MRAVLADHLREVVSLVVPLITWVLANYFSNRPRLVRSKRHSFTYLIQQPLLNPAGEVVSLTQTAQVASLSVVNTGRISAKRVEIVFNWTPQHYNIWPSRHYETKTASDGRFSVIFENLPPKDVVGFELLAINANLPEVVTVTSEQVTGTTRALALQPVWPRWSLWLILWLVLCGIAANVFGAITLIQAVSH